RMASIGHGEMTRLKPADAIAVAAASTPVPLADDVFQDEHGIPLGSWVSIASESFGPEPTEGELVAATRMHYTLRRTDDRAGTVHVHFPRIGYQMRTAKAA
ncbi:MAG: glutathione S-transferase family protein, partial [Haliea sp.]